MLAEPVQRHPRHRSPDLDPAGAVVGLARRRRPALRDVARARRAAEARLRQDRALRRRPHHRRRDLPRHRADHRRRPPGAHPLPHRRRVAAPRPPLAGAADPHRGPPRRALSLGSRPPSAKVPLHLARRRPRLDPLDSRRRGVLDLRRELRQLRSKLRLGQRRGRPPPLDVQLGPDLRPRRRLQRRAPARERTRGDRRAPDPRARRRPRRRARTRSGPDAARGQPPRLHPAQDQARGPAEPPVVRGTSRLHGGRDGWRRARRRGAARSGQTRSRTSAACISGSSRHRRRRWSAHSPAWAATQRLLHRRGHLDRTAKA